MNENELHERYIRLAFQYESAIDALLARGLVDEEAANAAKERFYDTLNEEKLRTTQKVRNYHETISLYTRTLAHDGMVSLTELARQYSDESPGYVIQSWMRSRNTLEFLRQWELEQNAEFDDQACAELIRQGHTTSLTITPTLWLRRTHAVGFHVKQGKGGGVSAYPEIAADFRLWLDPKERVAIISKNYTNVNISESSKKYTQEKIFIFCNSEDLNGPTQFEQVQTRLRDFYELCYQSFVNGRKSGYKTCK